MIKAGDGERSGSAASRVGSVRTRGLRSERLTKRRAGGHIRAARWNVAGRDFPD